MRLLHTSKLCLEEFVVSPPRYAILSHTWAEEEALFKDVENNTAQLCKKNGNSLQRDRTRNSKRRPTQEQNSNSSPMCSDSQRYNKLLGFCKLAESNGYEYCWMDTCCIDKSSSAELSEAINSMFAYYRNSHICYVYLDIETSGDSVTSEELRSSRWIKRGWTLQELIAPKNVCFFDRHWKFCGSRASLAPVLTQITHIDLRLLHNVYSLGVYSIATKMSWASGRETTRPEDIAYCLFGIFEVHLPPLYGEGQDAAFKRLQEEIIKNSMDLSFLAWDADLTSLLRPRSGLARSPESFRNSGVASYVPLGRSHPFHMTNKGLCLTLPLIDVNITEPTDASQTFSEYIMVLPGSILTNIDEPPKINVRVRIWQDNWENIYYRCPGLVNRPEIVEPSSQQLSEAQTKKFYLAVRDLPPDMLKRYFPSSQQLSEAQTKKSYLAVRDLPPDMLKRYFPGRTSLM
ncbi:hypothetical protein IAQ61_005149 [Plenodomus lingam]|uniref:uncharacterized protein n=1 Tax=Leptosphaeria maculans TaxID=5022 RepID=UPI00331A3600|nr:hypothetical protein IAQ61_005149 [Plenodomus lingam]